MKNRRVGFVDVTTRDGHQSLWATRMTNKMILPFIPRMDEMGFDWINLVGGAVFDVCVRFLHEDPWERMRLVTSIANKTGIDVMTRGQSLFTFGFYPDDVVELTIRRIAANGVKRITVYDSLNDPRNLELSIQVGIDEGLYVCAGIVYTLSPVHSDEFFQNVAAELVKLGANSLLIKDPAGLLLPDRIRTLVPALKQVIGPKPLEIHSHSLSGMAEPCYLEAACLGVDVLHTASHPLASGASLPPTEYCVRHLGRKNIETVISLKDLSEMEDYFTGVARRYGFPLAVPCRFDPELYRHQVPGGMISNLREDLKRMNMVDRLEEILDEAAQVRIDLGYPILVSPFAQFVITQAMLNVIGGKRYNVIPIEVKRYVLGGYGRLVGEVSEAVLDKVADETGAEPYLGRAGDIIDPLLGKLRRDLGFKTSDEDVLLAAFYSQEQLQPLFQNRPWKDTCRPSNPLGILLSSLAGEHNLRDISLTGKDLHFSVRWRD